MSDFVSDLKDKALDLWKRAPTVCVVAVVALLLLCSTCCLCGGCMGSYFGSDDVEQEESIDGGEVPDLDELPS